jgi:hypothetical protein
VQVDPIKPTLKAPATERLKQNIANRFQFCFNFAFDFNLHRYTKGMERRQLTALLRGRPVQVDPIKLTLRAPGTKRLKLEQHEPLSKPAFKINLRRYPAGTRRSAARSGCRS